VDVTDEFVEHNSERSVQGMCTLHSLWFLPARRYASAGNSDRNVSVRPSVRHAPVLCQNEESMISSPSGSPKTLVF